MSYTNLTLANKAGGKIGGFGDQLNGNAFLPNLTGTDKVTSWVNLLLPQVRQHVICDFAKIKAPFVETRKYADLGDELKQNDNVITSITVGATPFAVTVTTEEAHEYSTNDTVMLFGIQGTGGITSLNNTLYKITKTTDYAFTLSTSAGVAIVGSVDWVYTVDTGISSDCPEIGKYEYAFTLPSDFLCMSRLLNEIYYCQGKTREYQFETILNKDNTGYLLLTNELTNLAGTSVFIEYCIDQTNPALFSDAFAECFATVLAAELCPIVGKDIKTRQQMLLEYEQLSKPSAKGYNQSQFNNEAHVVPNYLGGRGCGTKEYLERFS